MVNDLKDVIKRQFGPSADCYATSDVHAHGESLDSLVRLCRPQPDWQVLDVATGAGHTALSFAPHVSHVTALDLTSQMLSKTTDLAVSKGLANISTLLADAESLPFDTNTFDLLACRLAFHHFPSPDRALAEFARVLKPAGILGFTDNFTVVQDQAAQYYNTVERLRDPSHQCVYSLDRLLEMMKGAGLTILTTQRLSKEFEFQAWADRQGVSESDKDKLLEMMRKIPPPLDPLFAPRYEAGTMYFSLWEAVIVARTVLRSN